MFRPVGRRNLIGPLLAGYLWGVTGSYGLALGLVALTGLASLGTVLADRAHVTRPAPPRQVEPHGI